MINGMIFPGRYVQGTNLLKRLGVEAKRFGKNALVIASPSVLEGVFPTSQKAIEKDITLHVEKFGGECCDKEINRLKEIVEQNHLDLIIGIGGGKTIDTAKTVAFYAKNPVIVVPTIASTDAPCSALAVIYTENGEFDRYIFFPKNPEMVLVDTSIIANAPVRFLVSGMGDALSTWFEAESNQKKYAANMAGYVGTMTAYALAKLCYDTLLNYGIEAKTAVEVKVVTPALDKVIEANILLSGIGFESGGLAAAHAIHNGLTALEETHHMYHGEKVTIGVLASLFLTDKPRSVINEVYTFCLSVGLPVTLEDIGIKNISEEKLRLVAEKSMAKGETIHNELVPITQENIIAALIAADAEGKRRKKTFDQEKKTKK
jgi:glycerol dehydrogenase